MFFDFSEDSLSHGVEVVEPMMLVAVFDSIPLNEFHEVVGQHFFLSFVEIEDSAS